MVSKREEQEFFRKKENQAKRTVQKLRKQSEAIVRAEVVKSFAEIDLEPLQLRMKQLQEQVEKLQVENDVLQQLQAEKTQLEMEIRNENAGLAKIRDQRSQ